MKHWIISGLLCLTFTTVNPADPWDKPSGISDWDEYAGVEREVAMERNIKEKAFRPGQQYKYFYDGQVISGVTSSGRQHSGTRIQAVVTLQMESQIFLMQLKHVRFAKLNKDILDPQHIMPFRYFDPIPLTGKFEKKMEMPVKFQYVDGMVKNIYFEATDPPETCNIKRGIMNLLQINMQEQRSTETEHQRLMNIVQPRDGYSKFFRTMEDTIEGECEVAYSVTKQPTVYHRVAYEYASTEDKEIADKPRLNITKSINFEKCSRRPQVFYNYRSWTPCCQNENNALKSSSIMKYNVLGGRKAFLIETASGESQHTVGYSEEDDSHIKIYISQALKLFKTEPVVNPILQEGARNGEPGLMYNQEWDRRFERSYMRINGREMSPPTREWLLNQATDLLKKFAGALTKTRDTPASSMAATYYSNLISALRKMNRNELETIVDMVYRKSSLLVLDRDHTEVIKDILVPAVASTGTGDALEYLTFIIEHFPHEAYRVITALRQLPNSYMVSSEMVEKMKLLCESGSVQSNQEMRKSCYLTLGSFINALCVGEQDQLASDAKSPTTEHCTISQKEEYVQIFINKMQQSTKWEDEVLYLKALGNAGLDVSVGQLESIILNTGKVYPEYVRHEAIAALRKPSRRMSQRVQKVLMSVFMSPKEPAGLRQLAAQMIITTQPQRSILQLMAKQINTEPYRQVAMFTYQLMEEMANSTNPCSKRLASDLKLALKLTKPYRPNLYDSKMFQWGFGSVLENTGFDVNLFKMMANNSLTPRLIGSVINANALGLKSQHMLYWNLFTEGFEAIFSKHMGNSPAHQFSLNDILSRKQRNGNNRQIMRDIFDKLKIQHRPLTEQMRAYFDWGMFGDTYGFYPISEDVIRYFIRNGFAPKLERSLRSGKTYHMNWHHTTMLEDSVAKIPTIIGFPLIISHKMPVVMKVEGSMKAKVSGNWKAMELMTRLNPSLNIKREQIVEMWSPITSSGIRFPAVMNLHLPIAVKAEVDVNNMELNLKMESPTVTKDIIHMEMEPIMFTRDAAERRDHGALTEKIVYPADTSRMQWDDKRYSGVGMDFQLNTVYTKGSSQQKNLWLPISALAGPNKIHFRALKPLDNTKEITAKILLTGSYREQEPIRTFLLHNRLSESESGSLSSEETEPKKFIRKQHRYGSVVFEVNTNGGVQPKKYQAIFKTSGNLQGRFSRLTGKLAWISPKPYQVCLESEMFYPKVPFTRESGSGKKINLETKFSWGQSCNTNNHIQISTVAERTSQQEQWEKAEMESYYECKTNEDVSPIQCYEFLRTAGFMNKYTFNIKYNNVPTVVRNVTSHLFRIFQWKFYPSLKFTNIDVYNPPNQIKAALRINPTRRTQFNMTVKSPGENLTITDAISPIRIPRLNAKQSFLENMLDEIVLDSTHKTYQYFPECQIHSDHVDRVETFDGRRYHAPLTNCWSVVAKDCSREQQFVVLMKKVSKTSDLKTVKIITPEDRIKLKKSGPQYVIKQNGRRYVLLEESSERHSNSDHDFKRCISTGPYIMCQLREVGLTIYYDGFSAHIKISPTYIGKMCGLCGHMNFEPADDFQSPEFKATTDIRHFQYSYIYKDEMCHENSLPAPSEMCSTKECIHKSAYEPLTSAETHVRPPFQYYNKHRKNPEPRIVNRILHRMGRTCFSKEALATCPEYSHAEEAVRKEVEYSCLNEGDNREQELIVKAGMSQIHEARELPTEFVRMEIVPTLCRHYRHQQKL